MAWSKVPAGGVSWKLRSECQRPPNTGFFARETGRAMVILSGESAEAETEHPVVRTHPETGRRGLFVNPVYTIRLKDMSVRESAPLLNFLYDHAATPEFTCRFAWRPDSLAVWDNRCTQHLALGDYDGHRRRMYRTATSGDQPV